MFLSRTVGPTSYPVTRDQAKLELGLDGTENDLKVDGLIAASTRVVGEMAGRVLTEETWALSRPAISTGDLVLPKSPVQSVSSVTYFDGDDVEQSATVGDFYLMKGDDRAVLRPKSGTAWPAANTDRDDAVTVTFVAGYATCPQNLAQAVLMMVVHLHDYRGVAMEKALHEIPIGLAAMIGVERLGWVGA